MIEQVTIDGRSGLAMYMLADFKPCDPADAELVKVRFDDGDVVFLVPSDQAVGDKEWNEEDHPRGKTTPESTPGSFAPKGGGGGAKTKVPPKFDDWVLVPGEFQRIAKKTYIETHSESFLSKAAKWEDDLSQEEKLAWYNLSQEEKLAWYNEYRDEKVRLREKEDAEERTAPVLAAAKEEGIELNPKVIDVGGDEWNRQTAVRLEREYALEKEELAAVAAALEGKSLAGVGRKAETWEELSGSEQEAAEESYYSTNLDTEIQSQAENATVEGSWFYEEARLQVAKEFEDEDEDEYPEWANKAMLEARRDFLGAKPETRAEPYSDEELERFDKAFPFTDEQLFEAIDISDSEDVVEFDDDKMAAVGLLHTATAAGQQTLPGVEEAKPSDLLTPEMRDMIAKHLKEAYEEAVQEKLQANVEAYDFSEEAKQSLQESWSFMDDEQKFTYASPEEQEDEDSISGVIEEPAKFDPLQFGRDDSAYRDTQVFARAMSIRRGAELMFERRTVNAPEEDYAESNRAQAMRIFEASVARADSMLWRDWKSSSTSEGGKVLQAAIAEVLGARHSQHTHKPPSYKIYPPDPVAVGPAPNDWMVIGTGGVSMNKSFKTEAEAKAFVEAESAKNHSPAELLLAEAKKEADDEYSDIGGFEGVKALVRAKWETTQYMLEKAGVDTLPVYRGLKIKGAGASRRETIHTSSGSHARMPDIEIKRNGAASTSIDVSVANDWSSGDDAVVLRALVPRTAVVSVPAYGINIHSEREVVIAGTAWVEWDAWSGRYGGAPTYDVVPARKQKNT